MALSAASAMSVSWESLNSASSGSASRGRMEADASMAASRSALSVTGAASRAATWGQAGIDFPIAGGPYRFGADLFVGVVERGDNLIRESSYVLHREHRRQPPIPLLTGVRRSDRVPVPVGRNAYRGFQDTAPHFLRDVVFEVAGTQRLLDSMERVLGDRLPTQHLFVEAQEVIVAVQIHLLQDRSERQRRPGAQRLGRGGVADDRQQGAGEVVVDGHELAGHFGGQEAFRFIRLPVAENRQQSGAAVRGPLPG